MFGFLKDKLKTWVDKAKESFKSTEKEEAEKQEIIFNEHKINFYSTIYLVEGATDHIVTPNSIPLLGKYISPKLLELLHDNAMSYIVIVLDDDAEVNAITEPKQAPEIKESVKLIEPDEYKGKSSEELKNMLATALDEEQYEMASKIRDELNQRKKS